MSDTAPTSARAATNASLTSPFASFMMAGYECSTHVGHGLGRHDLLRVTQHDERTLEDYRLLQPFGIRTVREGLRWNLIEPRPGVYDFSSALPMLRAARAAGVQVIWDLFHFGWPDDLSPFSSEFVARLAGLARAWTRVLCDESPESPLIVPVNELSFLSWAAGEVGHFHPFGLGRGNELKRNLVRASLEASAAVRAVAPTARLIHPDPSIHVVAPRRSPELAPEAAAYREAQYAAWDMISGRLEPELGGRPEYLDLVGLNFYPHNQWEYETGEKLQLDDPRYRPFSLTVQEVFARYGRPLLVTETGAQGALRAPWLRYVGYQVERARRQGVPLHGLCLYPILDHPGWDDDRHVRCGLWGFRRRGTRHCDEDYALEIERLSRLFSDLPNDPVPMQLRPRALAQP